MSIRGITFTSQVVKSDDDGSLHDMLLASKSGIIHGCTTTSDANNIYIGAGRFVVRGRMIEVQGTETITPSTVLDGTKYCCLVFEIDLTKSNTTDTFNQGYFKVISSTSTYPTLTQENINTGGDLHQYLWAKFTQTSQGIASFSVQASVIDGNTGVSSVLLDRTSYEYSTANMHSIIQDYVRANLLDRNGRTVSIDVKYARGQVFSYLISCNGDNYYMVMGWNYYYGHVELSKYGSGTWTDYLCVGCGGDSRFVYKVMANATTAASLGTTQLRNISAGTTELTSGTSALATGDIYVQYE